MSATLPDGGGSPVFGGLYMRLHIHGALITWDERKRRWNLRAHGIDFADLCEFFDGDLLTREDASASYGEMRFQSIGIVDGVPLFVVWTLRGDAEVPHVISARKAEKHEAQAWFGRYSRRH